MNKIMNKIIAFTSILLCSNAIASETNPFLPYQYIEDKSAMCEKEDPVEQSLSETGRASVNQNLDFVAEVDGVKIYYDSAKDVYVEISNNE